MSELRWTGDNQVNSSRYPRTKKDYFKPSPLK